MCCFRTIVKVHIKMSIYFIVSVSKWNCLFGKFSMVCKKNFENETLAMFFYYSEDLNNTVRPFKIRNKGRGFLYVQATSSASCNSC